MDVGCVMLVFSFFSFTVHRDSTWLKLENTVMRVVLFSFWEAVLCNLPLWWYCHSCGQQYPTSCHPFSFLTSFLIHRLLFEKMFLDLSFLVEDGV
ncbi:hypothetical protein NPIL_157021 [Nephila pilipes]|uniref:Uncharacterized protein n=1 Tax=Nephila pilipes TaxID=299642 RepID=A0A8X6NS14_NEPPI|nr:hypothetical protein NPIL_157021 [Nephila pilipes]